MVYKFFEKKLWGGGDKNENISKQELTEELHKPIYRKFQKQKVYSSVMDKIWGSYLADMQLINKFNKGIIFFSWVIEILSKYASIVPLKDKKCIAIANDFQQTLDQFNRKPNKMWADKDSEFYKRSLKSR